MSTRQDGVENRDKVYHKNRFGTGMCVFEISQPNQELYKPRTKNNSKYWLFLHSYFNKIRPNLVCQVLVGRLMEVTTINNVKTLVGTARWSLNRGLISHLFLQLFRGIDYWPPNEGWLLNRWPLNEVQLYTEWVKGLRGNPT